MKKIKIGVDAFPLKVLNGGISYYVFYLLDQIIAQKPECLFVLYTDEMRGTLNHFLRYPNVTIKTISYFKFSHCFWRLFSLTITLLFSDVDIFWGTTQYIPLIKRKKMKTFLTLYDFVYLFSAESMPFFFRSFFKFFMPSMLEKADYVLPISLGSAKRLKILYGRSHDRILYPPIRPEIYPRDKESVSKKIEPYDLIYNQYFVTVGTIEPRKNFVNLVQIYLKILQSNKDLFPLAIIGGGGWKNKTINQILSEAKKNHPNHVKILGFVSDEDLPYFISGANHYVALSLYEGYGMPLAESRLCNTPVICLNTKEMKEATENDAIFLEKKNLEKQLKDVLLTVSKEKKQINANYSINKQSAKIFCDLI